MTAQSSKPEMEHFLKEWEVARSVLNNFDERLHDLRKVGFTFITALLAADAIIFKDSGLDLDQSVKFVVLILNFGLIVTLLLLDRNYRVFQTAAATRATVIERKINLELTEVISQRYDLTKVPDYITGLYIAFTILVLFMGFAVLSETYKLGLFVVWGIAIVIIHIVNSTIHRLTFPFGELDWTLDPLQCKKDEQVEITVNNLGKKTIEFEKNKIMWKILKEDDGSLVDSGGADNRDILIRKDDSFTWLWTPKIEGIYRVHRLTLDKETEEWSKFESLRRKIRVRK